MSTRGNDKLALNVHSEGRDVGTTRKKNPRVEDVKKWIRNYQAGDLPANQDSFNVPLRPDEYQQLLDEIEHDENLKAIFNHELRYSYTEDDNNNNQFVIRMPTSFHTLLSEQIDSTVKQWVLDFVNGQAPCIGGRCEESRCSDPVTIKMAQGLMGYQATSVWKSNQGVSYKQDPELSYKVVDKSIPSEYPGLVVVVGWSEESDVLERKCKWFIEQSNGETRTVIGIDLHDLYLCYPKHKTRPLGPNDEEEKRAIAYDVARMADTAKKNKALGKIFLWRADIDPRTDQATAALDNGGCKIFLDENGEPVGEIFGENPIGKVAFCLSLEDFLSEKDLEQIGEQHDPVFGVSSEKLCYSFNSALRNQLVTDRMLEEAKEQKGEDWGKNTGDDEMIWEST